MSTPSHDTATPTGQVLVLHSGDPETTRAVARAIAGHFQPGDVVALSGELGAGKTCFVQGVAQELGITAPITSPTFVLVKLYEGRLPITHCDVYRLDNLQDVDDLGDEVMAPDRVTFLEWGDAIRPLLPPDHLEVELLIDDETTWEPGAQDVPEPPRRLVLHGHGSWAQRWDDLRAATAEWT